MGFIIFIGLFFGGIFWTAMALVIRRKKQIENVKKEAREMLKAGTVSDPVKAQKVLKFLSPVRDDTEAIDIWQRLNRLVNP